MKKKWWIPTLLAACFVSVGAAVAVAADTLNSLREDAERNQQSEVVGVLKNINGCTFEAGVNSPAETLFPYSGVKVTTEAGGKFSFGYDGIINLNEGKDLVHFLIMPEVNGQVEMDDMVITLTDVYDEGNYITIDFRDGGDIQYFMTTYFQCSVSGKYKGLGYSWDGKLTTNGTSHRTSWRGAVAGFGDWQQSVLYYDVENNELRTRVYMWTTDNSYIQEQDLLIFDFEDSGLGANVFEGFTTNEVYFTVDITTSANQAHLLISEIGGVDLSGDTIAETPPQITIDYEGYEENNLPYGVAGEEYSYPVFEAMAYSPKDGVFEVNDVKVRYGGATIPVKNGRFQTEEEGLYQISYNATSKSGYRVAKTVEVEVKADFEEACGYTFHSEIPDVVYVGADKVYLPDGEAFGGYGYLEVKRSLIVNGKEANIYESGDAAYFIPEVLSGTQSDYVLRYEVEDVTGKSRIFEKIISVRVPTSPVISEITMPKAIRVGYATEFAIPTAYSIDAGGNKVVEPVTMKVNGTVCDGVYTPTQAGTLDVEFSAGASTVNYAVEALAKPMMENGNNWYFKPNGFTFHEATDKYVAFTKAEGASSLDFANVLCADTFNFSFDVTKSKVREVKVTLVDSVNTLQKVEFFIRSLPSGLPALYVGAQYVCSLSGSFTEDNGQYISFEYKDNSGYIISQNQKVAKIEYYANGEIFSGFSSGAVYFNVTVTDGEVGSDLKVVALSGHSFTKDVGDYKKPDISFDVETPLTRSVEYGDKFTVYAAKGWDVFSKVQSMMVQVNNPEQKSIYNGLCKTDFELEATMYGSYNITYTAIDEGGWVQRIYYTVNVVDTIAPEISADFTVKQNYSIGEKASWSEFTATDNFDTEVLTYCYVVIPTGEWKVLSWKDGKYEYTFEEKGTYRIGFAAVDDAMNMAYVEYEVQVG